VSPDVTGRNWDIGSIREPLTEALAALAAFGDDHIAFHPLVAEITELNADHAASIAALEEAAVLGRELGVWSDLIYVEGRLGIIRARAGDLAAGRVQLAAAERAIAARGELMDTDRWVSFMRAELAWLTGDYVAAAECCATVLAAPGQR
jgi:hypothetical protein